VTAPVLSLLIYRQSAAAQWQKTDVFDTPQEAMAAAPSPLWERIMPDQDVYISGASFPRFAVMPVIGGREIGAGFIGAWENMVEAEPFMRE